MNRPKLPRGILFDLDGTLAMSMGVMKAAYFEFLALHSTDGSNDEFDSLNGPPLREVVRTLCQTHNLTGTFENNYEEYLTLVARRYSNVQPVEGAKEILEFAKSHGLRTALVTSNSREVVSAWLKTNGLESTFDMICSGDDITRGKPDPEPYQVAMSGLSLEPSECVAIEDSRQGFISASSAQLHTFIVQTDRPVWLNDSMGTWVRNINEVVESLSA
ncbi:MAG: HAD family phosphatase [Actinobacteria bacterium]|nr:HAD family phosphatase [Actinomycetota bacterium]